MVELVEKIVWISWKSSNHVLSATQLDLIGPILPFLAKFDKFRIMLSLILLQKLGSK